MSFDWQFKTVLIGDGAVGKTSIRRRYLGRGFKSSHIPTLGVDFTQKYIHFQKKTIRFIIWDLAGQPSYERVRRHYYQGAGSLILVYSVIDRESFHNASKWLIEAHKYMGQLPPTAILANKIDLRPKFSSDEIVTSEEGENFTAYFMAKLELPALFIETSALTGENIPDAFQSLIQMMIESDIELQDNSSG